VQIIASNQKRNGNCGVKITRDDQKKLTSVEQVINFATGGDAYRDETFPLHRGYKVQFPGDRLPIRFTEKALRKRFDQMKDEL